METHLDTIPLRANIDENAPSAGIDQGGPNDSYYKWLIINLLDRNMTLLHEATVVNRISSKTGPLFLANSTNELVPVREIEVMSRAMIAANRPLWTIVIPGSAHAEGYFNQTIAATLDFFALFL